MSAVLDVTGAGTSRAGAIAHADQQAARHFHVCLEDLGILIEREVGRPRPVRHLVDGELSQWVVHAHYRDLRAPARNDAAAAN